MAFARRWILTVTLSFCFLFGLLHINFSASTSHDSSRYSQISKTKHNWWKNYDPAYPVTSMIPLPANNPKEIPRVQFEFGAEDPKAKTLRSQRRDAVKDAFLHSWKGYKANAWGHDEVGPVEGNAKDPFGGWGATLVDSLDTLWIMGLKSEFGEAVTAVRQIDFSHSKVAILNVFETTIRYLGGFLAAHDLTEGAYPVLLQKAVEVADLLYIAFDTPNRMPILRWFWQGARDSLPQEASHANILAELGSLSVEFTRLSQLTGEPKYFDAIQRITDVLQHHQNATKLPGMWPLGIDALAPSFTADRRFTFGAMSDSLYEYLPKEYLMLGGQSPQYKEMYERAMEEAREHLFFRPRTSKGEDILISGTAHAVGRSVVNLKPQGQHLTCFSGGMMAIASKIFDLPDDLEIGRKLTEGCIWAYRSMPSGVMPEIFTAVPCDSNEDPQCTWSPRLWFDTEDYEKMTTGELETKAQAQGLIPGFLRVDDAKYHLRPEAIESVFILYRISGDQSLQDKGWDMFTAIEKHARTDIAYGSLDDVTSSKPKVLNEMESFWTGETLKYFYLLFSEPDLVSLDKYVFNTEAHPLKRPS
ncbi:mannosyl-oligosaccharide 1,2-alpha-mannosidase [Emydomyces testavorans]|uniref:alpha-1,2-Mannosidase n=1 Tax=Emydomyces testavorans TaxID=2070801 RepID=A0AAF0ILZ1_9EURO|nr:mannosyl-oligosaccharide 1,2-alpha-mannosidase [Emydomyces testavorans]